MTRKALIPILWVLVIVCALAVIVAGYLGIWTGDGRWGCSSVLAGFLAVCAAIAAAMVAGDL